MKAAERIIKERTKTLHGAYAELAKIVLSDKLTGLSSRTKLDEVFEMEVKRYRRYGTEFSLILLDIDGFKQINDSFGHLTGDKILVSLGKILSEGFRNTDIVGRWVGLCKLCS